MISDTVIIIPSRIGSTRLKNKPLEKIGNLTMIEHVLKKAQQTGLPTYVATDSTHIASIVQKAKGEVIITRPECPSGTDRVFEALEQIPFKDEIKYVINLQGDMPFVDYKILLSVIEVLKNTSYKIVTPVVKVPSEIAKSDSNVKVVVDKNDRALYFSRSLIPFGENDEYLCHIGIYGFTKDILGKFVELPQSEIEKKERLEQLRALENGIDIGICYALSYPISVDTKEDLDKATKELDSNI